MQKLARKSVFAVSLAMMLALAFTMLTSCAEKGQEGGVAPTNALYVIMPDDTHGFLGESINHTEDELKNLQAETGLVYVLHKTADAELQSQYLDEAIEANASAVVLWPITGEPLREAAQRVMDAGIPLIVYDRLIPGMTPDSEVLGDNVKIGEMAGAYFNAYFADSIASGEIINILEFAGDDSTVPVQRTGGFMSIAGENVNVIENYNTRWRKDVARTQMQNWLELSRNEEIESIAAIYTIDDEVLLGVMEAIAAYDGDARLNIRLAFGVGGSHDVVTQIEHYKQTLGIDIVTYAFTPAMMREAIRSGVQAGLGETLPRENLIDTIEVDLSTLGEYFESETYQTRYER